MVAPEFMETFLTLLESRDIQNVRFLRHNLQR